MEGMGKGTKKNWEKYMLRMKTTKEEGQCWEVLDGLTASTGWQEAGEKNGVERSFLVPLLPSVPDLDTTSTCSFAKRDIRAAQATIEQ